MKNVNELEINKKYDKIKSYDLAEIDNPDVKSPIRLSYFDRINKIVSEVEKACTNKNNVKIGEFGCAQGNISLVLAELGYKTFALDINKIFLEYSRMKYETGEIDWILANIDNLPIKRETFDIIILGEVIEHCANPKDVILKIFNTLRPNGKMIITTPNGSKIGNKLLTFQQVVNKQDLVTKQFGPDGEFHLFLFKIKEFLDIIPDNSKIVDSGYLGGTLLINALLFRYPIFQTLPAICFKYLIRILSYIPYINKKTFSNIYLIINKI